LEVEEAVLKHPLLEEEAWIRLRDSGRFPLVQSELVTTLRGRAEFLTGAWLLDRIVPPSLGGTLMGHIQPQMLRAVDALNAGRFRNGVLMPRRSAKTTTLFCILLGRCYLRPVHMAGYTMLTTAKKTTERFRLDIYGPIVRQWHDKKLRPVNLINSNGFERVEFDNGSVLAILSPDGDAIRSGAYDTLVLDESGEAEPDKWDDVIAAIVPAFDTRGADAQLILAGTAGDYREGSYYWKVLHDPDAGIIRYGVPDDVDPATMASWDGGVGDLITAIHPGLDGLTSIGKIRSNFDDLRDRFPREYLGYFGLEHAANTLIRAATWEDTKQPGKPPEGVVPRALVFAIHPNGNWASIGVTWLIADGADLAQAAWELDGTNPDGTRQTIGFKLIHHQRSAAGMAEKLLRLSRNLNLPITYDDQSPQTKAVAHRLDTEAKPKPKLNPQSSAIVRVAVAQLLNGLEQGYLHHWAQDPLDGAAAVAIRKDVGPGYVIGRPRDDEAADITALECFAIGAHATPLAKTRQKLAPIVID
jgi:hypothetical protein